MRFVLRLLLAIAVALGVGFGLSTYALTDGRLFGAASMGPWLGWPDVGSPTPNPYTRAHIARDAALHLGRSEGIEFIASTDSTGAPLDLACRYRIEGRVPVSTFWSLAAIDEAWVNLAAPDTQPSLRSSEIVRRDDGSFSIHVGTSLSPGNWLELAGTGPFRLVMTLYDTTALSSFATSHTTMPEIVAEACP